MLPVLPHLEMEGVPKGSFDWQIDNFVLTIDGQPVSAEFNIGGNVCWLDILGQDDICETSNDCYVVYLNIADPETFRSKIFLKLCLIKDRGDEFLVTKRNGFQRKDSYVSLMLIEKKDFYLEENNLLPGGALTLRLSWGEEESNVVREEEISPWDLDSRKDSTKLFEKLGEDLGTFYESKTLTDSVLIVGNGQFPVHRAVLAARSPVFAAMFGHDTSENRSGEVNIHDVDPAVLSDVLYYAYSGQVRGLTTDTAAPMYTVADKYAFTEMKDICLDFLMSNLTIDNVSDAAVVAHAHGESALENEVIKLIELNSEELLENDRWKEFYQSNPYLAIKYLHFALASGNKRKPKKLK